jgi:mannitol-1-phosphate/altronate dehydrogenase
MLLFIAGLGLLGAQSAAAAIYSCTTPDGRRLTSDRPIAECSALEQKIHRRDGSVRDRLPPALSPEQVAAQELKRREEAVARAAVADATRYDRNLLARYPNKKAHDKARQVALDDLSKAQALSESRLADLAKDRKGLDEEAEFYKGKALPPQLRRLVDANDAARDAQLVAIANQTDEKARVNRRYDVELRRLTKLWGGALVGTLGPAPSAAEWEAPASTPAKPGSASPPASS